VWYDDAAYAAEIETKIYKVKITLTGRYPAYWWWSFNDEEAAQKRYDEIFALLVGADETDFVKLSDTLAIRRDHILSLEITDKEYKES
jgi:hypothetical protein